MSSNISAFHYENDLFSNLNMPVEYEDSGYELTIPADYFQDVTHSTSFDPRNMPVIVAVIIIVLLVGVWLTLKHEPVVDKPVVQETTPQIALPNSQTESSKLSFSPDLLTFAAPYTDYALTQGIHGMSYGHMAIDIAAGRGEPILATQL
jgi:hypothetical protein